MLRSIDRSADLYLSSCSHFPDSSLTRPGESCGVTAEEPIAVAITSATNRPVGSNDIVKVQSLEKLGSNFCVVTVTVETVTLDFAAN
jgi:hypothetical protein